MKRFLYSIIFSICLVACNEEQTKEANITHEVINLENNDSIIINSITENYPSGKLKMKREVDEKGNRRGIEKVYYENGILKHEIHFIGDMPWSVFKGNTIDGKPLDLGNLIFGAGSYNEYYDNGVLRKSGIMKDSKPDSLWQFFDVKGRKEREVSWKQGIQEGPSKHYYKSGNLYKELPFKNGLMQGTGIEYYDKKGAIRQTREYMLGKGNGEVRHYTINGNLESLAKMSNGFFIDTCYLFDAKGKIIDKKVMKQNTTKKTNK